MPTTNVTDTAPAEFAKKPIKLTDTAIASATKRAADGGKRAEIADAIERGLRLRITPRGVRTWVLGARDREGRLRRWPLGAYPAQGIADARKAARAMRESVRKGADPIAERRARWKVAADAKAGIGTLRALLVSYNGRGKRGQGLRTWDEQSARMSHVFTPLMDRPLLHVTRLELQRVIDAHPGQHAASAAVRYLRPVVKWAADRGLAEAGLALVAAPATVKRRDRVLFPAELAKLLPVIRADRSGYGACYRLILLTLLRLDEATGLRWKDVDLEHGTLMIGADRAKNGREHSVRLPRQAVDLLAGIGQGEPADLIFRAQSRAKKGELPQPLGALANHDRATKRFAEAVAVSGWTRHDLRRTGATLLGEMGEPPHIIEAALNHAAIGSEIASLYNRSRYDPERAEALQRLADRLDGIERGGAEIVPLRPRAASA